MPTEQKTIRKLRAILSADVKGYSLLMADDEVHTIQTLKAYRQIMFDLIIQHSGRVIDSPGDNLLAEFGSALDALECAVDIQKRLKKENERFVDDKRLQFRIGINIGDVVQDEDRIYGSGVNIAARIEGLADPGGVCISRNAYDHIKDKLKLGYEYLGQHEVKNIKDPVRVYRVLSDPEDAGKLIGEEPKRAEKKWVWPVVIVAAIIVASIVWHFYQSATKPDIEPATIEKMAFPLPEKPSIVVLPFVNISGKPDQEFLCDGITEDLITSLSKTPELMVIARTSSYAYKGKPVTIAQISEDLGVKYVLEGSLRTSNNRVRITAQLIDAITGHHTWAETYDRDISDFFEMEEEIILHILAALQVQLTEGDQAIIWRKGAKNIKAYLNNQQALQYFRRFTKEGNFRCRELAKKTIAIYPNYVAAYRMLAWTYWMGARYRFDSSPADSIKKATALAQKALSMDDTDPGLYYLLAGINLIQRKHNDAIKDIQKAHELYPNGADILAYKAFVFNYSGRPSEALAAIKNAMRLNPHYAGWYESMLGVSYQLLGQYEEALKAYKKAANRMPNSYPYHARLAIIYSILGRNEEARAKIEKILTMNPNFSIKLWRNSQLYRDKAASEMEITALIKAGLPYTPPLPLPDKPSIAVLAFENMSEDPKQEYFSDGISEEIINALSKTNQLFVIARESTFSYKGKQVKVQQIGRELGVKYILEGSVRKTQDRVRITAQLIDATKGHHLWSERYDRDLKDIFALQDEITMKITTALQVKLTEGEQARMWSKTYKTLDILLKSMEALSLWRKGTEESHMRFGQVAQEIVDMAPESVVGYRALGYHYWYLARRGKSPQESIAKALKLAQKALSLDEFDAFSHSLLGSVYFVMREYEKAIAAGERSIKLDPNGAMYHGLLGLTLSYAGKPDEAIGYLKKGIRLNPFPAYWYFSHLSRCYMLEGQYEDALTAAKKALHRAPNAINNYRLLAMIYALLDRQEEAGTAVKKFLEIKPSFSVKRYSKTRSYKNQADLKLIIDALRKAGFPE